MKTIKLQSDKVNFIFSADWHLSAVPPGRRADDYQQAILNKLAFLLELTNKVQGICLCGGDVFHIKGAKSPANSLNMLIEVLHCLRLFPEGKVFGTVGNHDLGYGERMDSLSGQPLGLLMAAGAYFDLSEDQVIFCNNIPGSGHLGLPSIRVMVESFPYGSAEDTLRRILASKHHPDATHRVGIVHAYGQPGKGGTLWGEQTIGYDQIAGTDFDFLLWGHDHGRIETEKVGNVTNVHPGSLARAALDTDEKERPVSCAILSFADDGIRYKEKEIPVKPLEAVFISADRGVRATDRSKDMKDFLARMDEAVGSVEASDPAEALRMLCPDDPKLLGLAKESCGL